eukprot:5780293-Alexandrium_andersonii.AAC.1
MSASLVGSEMCIRDRDCRCAATAAPPSGSASALELAWCGAWRRGSSGPVSYTHLTLPTICSV